MLAELLAVADAVHEHEAATAPLAAHDRNEATAGATAEALTTAAARLRRSARGLERAADSLLVQRERLPITEVAR